MNDTTEIRVAYTRGKKLHAATFSPDATTGRTLCGRPAWRHSRFGPDLPVRLSLRINSGCQRCLKALDKR